MARVCVLSVVTAALTERTLQLTFLTYLETLTKPICEKEANCVATVDLGLYRLVEQLIMSQPCLHNRFVLRRDELHIIMAFLRALGTSCDGSGIPELWEDWFSECFVQKNYRG